MNSTFRTLTGKENGLQCSMTQRSHSMTDEVNILYSHRERERSTVQHDTEVTFDD